MARRRRPLLRPVVTTIGAAATAFAGGGLSFSLLMLVHTPTGLALICAMIVLILLGVGFGIDAAYEIKRYHRERRVDTAQARGEALLLRLLTPVQRKEYQQSGTITIDVGDRRKAIIGKTIGGVKWRTPQGEFQQCVVLDQPHRAMPKEDDLITKLLALRTNPQQVYDLGPSARFYLRTW